jgi:hypothetical protein
MFVAGQSVLEPSAMTAIFQSNVNLSSAENKQKGPPKGGPFQIQLLK